MTILGTCKKLGISFLDYMKGIFSCNNSRPKLAGIIAQK